MKVYDVQCYSYGFNLGRKDSPFVSLLVEFLFFHTFEKQF